MRPDKQEWSGAQDLFRVRLDQIINLKHELVRLVGTIDWAWIDAELAGCFSEEGRPGLTTRFMVELLLLKHIHGLSDGKGKAHKPYEFGVKVSAATTNRRCKGGQFVLHAKALPGNPYDGHTLGGVIAETQALTGREIERAYVDKGYRGHNAPKPLRVFISRQKRGVFGAIKREPRRRSAIEPVIGHLKSDGHLGRNYLKGRHGDNTNAVLSAVGHNLRLILNWLRFLLSLTMAAILDTITPRSAFNPAS